jgi:imidazolonepropionase-like amidohydrolase
MKEGILTGIYYPGATGSMNLPFVAGHAVGYGLSKEEALQCITLNNAKILGIDKQYGTLEKGKDATLVISGGDILDIRTNQIEIAYISGRKIDLDNKHKQLYKKFKEKYDAEK